MKTFETEKHNIPTGATHYIDGEEFYLFNWINLKDSTFYKNESWVKYDFSVIPEDKIKPIPDRSTIDPSRMSGCEIAAAFKQLLPAATDCGLSYDMLNAIDEETLIDHIINSDVSLEKVIRECSKALIQTESEPKMMPKVEALIQELLDEPAFN